MVDAKYEWIEFYTKFATKLLDYKTDRQELIRKIRQVYLSAGIKLPKLESDNNPKDIDPFTVFGLFNKGITLENRIAIIKAMANEFAVVANIPETFEGIPVMNNLNATFYRFQEEREPHDIDDLWEIFESALEYADSKDRSNERFIAAYNAVRGKKGIRWKITMGLYWIRPYVYLNLDSRNRWYLEDPENMPANFVAKVKPELREVPAAETYLEICALCQQALENGNYEYKTFPELSYYAWLVSERVNEEKKVAKGDQKSSRSNAAHLKWSRPIVQALRDLGGSGTPAEVRAKIVENEQLTREELSRTRGQTNVNRFENEVAFARNDLANAGYIDRSVRGIWTLTVAGMELDITDERTSDLLTDRATENVVRDGGSDALADSGVHTVRYWIYGPGEYATKWEEFYKKEIIAIGWGEIGDLKIFDSKDEMRQKMKEIYGGGSSYVNSGHATWQFANEMKPGDVVFVKKGLNQIIGRGIVESDYEYDEERSDGYNHVRRVKWTHKGEWTIDRQSPPKILTDITPYSDFVQRIKDLFDDDLMDDDEEEQVVVYPLYLVDEFLDEVFMDETNYDNIVGILQSKKNIILQGAPGVGKTYVAKRLAYSIMGVKDASRVMMVQFHQSYSYEDFIMGFRPTATGFELHKGAFYNFCKKAEIDSDKEYFFIIDEINRGNLSKIFGELFMLIENDKRGIELQLLYSDEKFAVPKNVYIIGMMNTADRSLALLDYALRRRFAFVEITPGFKTDGFRAYQSGLDNRKFDRLIASVESLNQAIADDETLGEGFCLGHSYFCNLNEESVDDQTLSGIVEYELIPLLKEYWFDEPAKIRDWSNTLRGALK